MRYGSVCSGIEAASTAWEPLGWKPAWFCEIDPFASAVLSHHYPQVPNYGDFTRLIDPTHPVHAGEPVDVLVGGTPCQDFSVAGLRAGIEGDRGSLTLDFCRLVGVLRPKWVVWENVPGVLSSDGGRAFGAFIGALAELGYGFAWRVLDAQYFGLAQRRKRVFVVGCAGGESSRAGAVLLEPEGVRGNPPARRKARKEAAPAAGGGAAEPGGAVAPLRSLAHVDVMPTMVSGGSTKSSHQQISGQLREQYIVPTVVRTTAAHVVAPPLTATNDPSRSPQSSEVTAQVAAVVEAQTPEDIRIAVAEAFALQARIGSGPVEGDDNAAQGEPVILAQTPEDIRIVMLEAFAFQTRIGRNGRGQPEPISPTLNGSDAGATSDTRGVLVPDVAGTLGGSSQGGGFRTTDLDNSGAFIVTLQDTRGMDKKQNGKGWSEDDLAYTVDALATQGVARAEPHPAAPGGHWNNPDAPHPTLCVGGHSHPGQSLQDVLKGAGLVPADDGVRRITPRECERLQGFPDDYTRVPWQGKPADECSDGPRYRALGNSMAVPVMRWIGERVAGEENTDTPPTLAFKAGQSEAAGGTFVTEEFSPTLQAQNNGSTAVPAVVTAAGGDVTYTAPAIGAFTPAEVAKTLVRHTGAGAGETQNPAFVQSAVSVRRLTPRECERLQGFPDDYTRIPYRNGEAGDSHRYKSLGNSMAVPVMQWIGKRIATVE